jgi:hypothetical protein
MGGLRSRRFVAVCRGLKERIAIHLLLKPLLLLFDSLLPDQQGCSQDQQRDYSRHHYFQVPSHFVPRKLFRTYPQCHFDLALTFLKPLSSNRLGQLLPLGISSRIRCDASRLRQPLSQPGTYSLYYMKAQGLNGYCDGDLLLFLILAQLAGYKLNKGLFCAIRKRGRLKRMLRYANLKDLRFR